MDRQKLKVPAECLRLPVVGNYFRSYNAQMLLQRNEKAQRYRLGFLQPEPDNRHDKNAVRVLMPNTNSQGEAVLTLVGYIQRHSAAVMSQLLRRPENKGRWGVCAIYRVNKEDYMAVPFGTITTIQEFIEEFNKEYEYYRTNIDKLLGVN